MLDTTFKVHGITDGLDVDTILPSSQRAKNLFFKHLTVREKVVILFLVWFPDEVALPINPNILYWREIDLMGNHSSSYRVQALAVDMVFVIGLMWWKGRSVSVAGFRGSG